MLKELEDALQRFCAYRERCTSEVESKLRQLGANSSQIPQLIKQLTKEGFVDNQRFAYLFARSKFSNNHWGRVKIRAELLRRDIPDNTIRQALSAIDEKDYIIALETMLNNKYLALSQKHPEKAKEKAAAYALQKGYEADAIWQAINRL